MEKKGGSICCHLEAAHTHLQADAIHLGNTLNNLLDNAIKYSERPPVITIGTKNYSRNLRIFIRDKGKGVNPKEHHLIFQKFYRGNSGNLYPVKGFGLGLPYVKMVVEMHGGKIDLESQEGKGSTFLISVPFIYKNQTAYAQRETFVD